MIIIRLKGGLGNQMFQYAMGRALAEKYKIDFKLDIRTGFEKDFYKRQYKLNHFNIIENIASEDELKKVRQYRSKNLLAKIYSRMVKLLPVYQRYYINEEAFNNSNKIFSKNVDRYLDGYWQSEKYFKDIEQILIKEFTLKVKLSGEYELLMKQIIEESSVAIHVRKYHGVSGDGKVDEQAPKIYNDLSENYYAEAIEYISSKIDNAHLYIFSDNSDWTRNKLRLAASATIVSGFEDYEDLVLMSKCKHRIIANSTFSWWGAWLNKNPDKIVITPKLWYTDFKKNEKSSDLIPNGWVRL